MDRIVAIAKLRDCEAELRAMGIASLSLFGSTARGEAGPASDIDLAATFDPLRPMGLFRMFSIEDRLSDLLEVQVDLVGEPAQKPFLQAAIERDRVRVF